MRYRTNNILALVRPNKEGESVLKQTLFFQKSLGMRIFIYNIIDKLSIFERLFNPKKSKYLQEDALRHLQEFVEHSVQGEVRNKLTYRVKMGNPGKVLLRQAKMGGYEFMIIDKSEPEGGLTREETDKIISRSECPVLSVNKNYYVDEITKIVIPVNISQSTKKKLLWATYFAKKYGATIKIVSALSINISANKSLAWKNAEKLKQILLERGFKCDVDILKAKGQEKHEVILDYIHKENPGLIILRTHQESNMAGTEIGKFVSELVHGSQIPVFTVNRFLNPMPVDFEL
jgi:nucleotide-binding universal stress UspA family protein